MFCRNAFLIGIFISGGASAGPHSFYEETSEVGSCGVEWDAKYGCAKGARLNCVRVDYPISKLGDALSVGSRTICTDGRNTDTSRSSYVKVSASGERLSLDAMVPESVIVRSLHENESFRNRFKLSSVRLSLVEHMATIPEVKNFTYSDFTIASVANERLLVDFFVRGDWEERDQRLAFSIQIPKSAAMERYRAGLLRFGEFSAILNANKSFKKKDATAAGKFAAEYLRESDLSTENLAQLNDAGFFLEQANRAKEAVPVLERVVAFDPSRTPAYLNLADAYAKAGDKVKAKTNYQTYVDLMEKSGKGAKIPSRVRTALKP